jgi:3-oxoacyl-[acyl-carrier-protein] synthase-1
MTQTSLRPAYLHGFETLSAAGRGLAAIEAAWALGQSPGMVLAQGWGPEGKDLPVGRVQEALPSSGGWPLQHQSRNNQLALAAVEGLKPALEALKARYGAPRIGVVVGTSTSGVLEAEQAFAERHASASGVLPQHFHYGQQEIGSPAQFLAWSLGLKGPLTAVSTACSSSAKALATARRWLRLGVCDAVLAGGVDSLCRFTVQGFAALGAVSLGPCRPFGEGRDGINIGEAAAFTLLTLEEGPIRLAGCGETSDAYNVSAPLPQGEGAEAAMRQALHDGNAPAESVGYLNLHGTATAQNDAMEAAATLRVFPQGVACSSTKPLTGHTLGAAGALEAAICWHLLSGAAERSLPPNWARGPVDPALAGLRLVQPGQAAPGMKRALSNSFGFGGSNLSLLLERA